MPTLAAAKAANSATNFAFKPTALFVGSTSGIGQVRSQALFEKLVHSLCKTC